MREVEKNGVVYEVDDMEVFWLILLDKFSSGSASVFADYTDLSDRQVNRKFLKLFNAGLVNRYRNSLYDPYYYFLTSSGMQLVIDDYYSKIYKFEDEFTRKPPTFNRNLREHQDWALRTALELYFKDIGKDEDEDDDYDYTNYKALAGILSDRDIYFIKYHLKNRRKSKIEFMLLEYDDIQYSHSIPDILYHKNLSYGESIEEEGIAIEIELNYKGVKRTNEKFEKIRKDWFWQIWLVPSKFKKLREILMNNLVYPYSDVEDIAAKAISMMNKWQSDLDKKYEEEVKKKEFENNRNGLIRGIELYLEERNLPNFSDTYTGALEKEINRNYTSLDDDIDAAIENIFESLKEDYESVISNADRDIKRSREVLKELGILGLSLNAEERKERKNRKEIHQKSIQSDKDKIEKYKQYIKEIKNEPLSVTVDELNELLQKSYSRSNLGTQRG